MKTTLAIIALGGAILTATAATPPLYEPFEYPTGANLIGQTSGQGNMWLRAGPAGIQPIIGAGNLSYPGLPPSIGNSALISSGGGTNARFPIGTRVITGTIYYSFIFQPRDLAGLSTAGGFFASFNNSDVQSTSLGSAGTRVVMRLAGNGFNVGLDKSSGGAANFQWYPNNVSPAVFSVNDTIFVVGSYEFTGNPTPATDDISRLWINPHPSTFGAASPPAGPLLATAGTDLSQVASFVLMQRIDFQPARNIVDELRIGLSWADVTPVGCADTAPPQVFCPGDLTVEATGPDGAEVAYSDPLASDDCDPKPTVVCSPPSGDTFPIGTTTVTCTATDYFGRSSTCSFVVTVERPAPPEVVFDSDLLPPPQGMFIGPIQGVLRYGNGVLLRNAVLRRFSESMPPPKEGETKEYMFRCEVALEHSQDGGMTWSPGMGMGDVVVQVTLNPQPLPPGGSFYETELLSLSITGLPGGVMIRESPTLRSTGRHKVFAPVPLLRVSGFFDVFTELSVDGGMTWSPGQESSRMELRRDPTTVPPVPAPTTLLPPRNDYYLMAGPGGQPGQIGFQMPGGPRLLLRNGRNHYFSQSMPPPPAGGSQTHQFSSMADMELSMDGGMTWQYAQAQGMNTVGLRNIGSSGQDGVSVGLYETEMLQMELSGVSPLGPFMIRESPSKQSMGGTAIGLVATGVARIGSFFDVFTELSVDGGQTWMEADSPSHVELRCDAPEVPEPSPNLPPPDDVYVSPAEFHAIYEQTGVIIKDVKHERFTQSQPPPGPGQPPSDHAFSSQVSMMVSQDGGRFFNPLGPLPTLCRVVVTFAQEEGNTRYFDTEMLQLDISGLPPGVMIRESPTLRSHGRTSMRRVADPQGQIWDYISSFFDVFTELSVDGGQTWEPARSPVRVVLTPRPIPCTIACKDITTWTVDSMGTVVSYPSPTPNTNCGTVTVSCSPPSGSKFPVGVTTVTCTATDAAGTPRATCSFNVAVRLFTAPILVFDSTVLPPPSGMFTTGPRQTTSYDNGLMIRNVVLRKFSESQPPPDDSMPSRQVRFTAEVSLEHSMDGMKWDPAMGMADVLVQISLGGPDTFDTEILSMSLTGPGGLMIRESPTRRSLGVTIKPPNHSPAARGAAYGSFFDVFTELSMDGGMTWSPAPEGSRVELRRDPTTVPVMDAPTDLLPPPNHSFRTLTGRPGIIYTTPDGKSIHIRNVRNLLFSMSMSPPSDPDQPPQTQMFSSIMDMEVSMDGGQTYHPMRGEARTTVVIAHAGRLLDADDKPVDAYETEMLQMEISGGGGGGAGGFLLRESPTKRSTGGLIIGTNHITHIGSFFDVFTELSVDGGQTWIESEGPGHVELVTEAPEDPFPSPNLPPPEGQYVSPADWHAAFAQGIIISNVSHKRFTQSQPPPPPGGSQTHVFSSTVEFMVSTDGGATFNPAMGNAQCAVRMTSTLDEGDTRYFDTEMLQLEISGGTLPASVRIRESPSRPSLGRTSIRRVNDPASGIWDYISSFFDVFVELSTDGGMTYTESTTGPGTVVLERVCTVGIDCPPDQFAEASSPAGAVVNYPPPTPFGTCPPFTVRCEPPSGSTFPIGTTGVTCHVVDSEGTANLCIFTVMVRERPGVVEVDRFEYTLGKINLRYPDGTIERVIVGGPSSVNVHFEGPTEGDARDDDGDGLDDVRTEMTELNLMGSSSQGTVMVSLNTAVPTIGGIEEKVNGTAGTLDLAPFGNNGCANSFFDVNAIIKVGERRLCPRVPLHIEAMICHKPPRPGEAYMNLVNQEIELLDCASRQPTGIFITGEMHTPNVPKEDDYFSYSQGKINLRLPDGTIERVIVAGPTRVQVCIDDSTGDGRGLAADLDGDGLEEVPTIMTELNLMGNSSAGPVMVGLHPERATKGGIEEKVNGTPGVLDLAPFGNNGCANSFFDVNAVIKIGERRFCPRIPLHIEAMICHKPPRPGEAYMNLVDQEIELLDCVSGQPTGIFITGEMHTPNPRKEIDSFSYSQGKIVLEYPNGQRERIIVAGPTQVEVCINDQPGSDHGLAADTDGDGLDQVPTVMSLLQLLGNSSQGPVNVVLDPSRPTRGEIEEKVNSMMGVLDLSPFGAGGAANSFFDVNPLIRVGTRTFRPAMPLRIQSMITHKPPAPGEAYMNLFTLPGGGGGMGPCEVPDNGTGTVSLPPVGCQYLSPTDVHMIIDGLPPGTTVELGAIHQEFICRQSPCPPPSCVTDDCDPRNGETEAFNSTLNLHLTGTGMLAGYDRMLALPNVSCQTRVDPRNPGDPVQSFDTEMLSIQGQLPPGDPDFDLLRITAGSSFGLPSPGHTTLTRLPNGNFNVDSFFDITYRIDFVGRAGGPFGGRSGSTTGTIRMQAGQPSVRPGIALLDENGNDTGIRIVSEMHTPNPRKEVDSFSYSQGKINLLLPDGRTERVIVAGPTRVEVCLEEPEGLAADTDADGLDEVPTTMTALSLMGNSSMGSVMISLDPAQPTRGEIEEKVNGTPGVLDLAPFGNNGCANSFFDVFPVIKIGGQIFRPRMPLHIAAMICHKPPRPGEAYMNLVDQAPIELLDANGNPTGIFITGEMHTPNVPKEIDYFSYSQGKIVLEYPNGQRERIIVGGPTQVEVCIDESNGIAADTDGDGLDQVPTEMTLLNLMGNSSQGAVMVSLDPNRPSPGGIEEKINSTAGVLDLSPFGAGGAANSFFDVNALIKVGAQTYRPAVPLHMEAMITHKPPAPGEAYMNLFVAPGGGGGMGPCEVPDNGSGTVTLPPAGCQYLSPDEVHMIIDGLPPGTTLELGAIHKDFICHRQGTAPGVCSFAIPVPGVDCDEPGGSLGGEKECADSTLQLNLRGTGALNGYMRQINFGVSFETHIGPRTPGQPVQSFDTDMFRLFGQITGDPDFDLLRIVAGTDFGLPSPGHTTLTRLPNGNWNVDSFFDITYRIDFVGRAGGPFGGRSGSTTGTIRMQAGQPSTRPGIALLDANGNDTGIRIVSEMHTPNIRKEVDSFSYSQGKINLKYRDATGTVRTERVIVAGPTTVEVCLEEPEGLAADLDADGLDQVPTVMTLLNLMGSSSQGTVMVSLDPNRPTRGEIEEKVNGTPGVLDLAPFGNQGCANSYFDVNPIIKIGGRVFRPRSPLHIEAMICHKPPRPGESYMNLVEQEIELLDENGNPTGIFITGEMHTPNLPKEIDYFSYSQGKIVLEYPNGQRERIVLGGPTQVEVCIDESNGLAADLDGDGLDDVPTVMTLLNLMGNSSQGAVMVSLNPNVPSPGGIEEKMNSTPGTLDLSPFGAGGAANSFFDVNALIKVGAQTYRPAMPLHMEAMITHKPPAPGEAYMNLFTGGGGGGAGMACEVPDNGSGTVTLPPAGCQYLSPDEVHMIIDGLPAGTTLELGAIHKDFICHRQGTAPGVCSFAIPVPGVDCDEPGGTLGGEKECADSTLQLNLRGTGALNGYMRQINFGVSFETHIGPRTPGQPVQSFDTDMFRLFGQITGDPDFDLLRIVAGTDFGLPSPGHTTLTRLPNGNWNVDSFFDITYRIDFVGAAGGPFAGRSGSTTGTIRMQAGTPVTPRPGIALLDENGNDTGIRIVEEMHTPNPRKEEDYFSYSQGKINLQRGQPGGSPDPAAPIERVIVAGPTRVLVCIDDSDGLAADTDADGLDEVPTEMAELNLMGNSSLGPIMIGLDPNRPTKGQIEEKVNGTAGVLDVAPFGNNGCANSFFDVFAVIKVGAQRFCTRIPLHIAAMICHKPPLPGEAYMNLANQGPIELVDCVTGQPTGIFIVGEMHTPNPPKEIDRFDNSRAEIVLCAPDGTEQEIVLTGPTTVEVCINDADGLAADTDGDGRDQVPTRMTQLDLTGSTPMGSVEVHLRDPSRHPNQASTGEIEEQANNTPGVLDIPPFRPTGCADTYFDMYVEVRLTRGPAVIVLHNNDPKRMRSVICTKPPGPGPIYESPERIPLFTEDEQPSGYFLCRTRHIPVPCRIDIVCPNDMTVPNDQGVCGAKVNYPAPTVTGDCPPINVACTPASGSSFPVGTTTVTCTATDAQGNRDTCTFTVAVRDTEPPRIVCPNDITVSTDPNACGARVTYPSPTATDNCAVAAINCAPASGSFFPVGNTIVTCTATDTSGNTAECKFTVTVRDTEPPIVTCPSNIVTECQGPNGTVVTYSPTATDNCISPVAVTCNPPSGSTFPVGTTTVICTATDNSGNVGRCTFTVTVRDTQAPAITCPNNIVAECQGPNGTPVTYAATATDRCDATPAVTCVPASGSLFPVGTTPVTCTATDDAGNTASCTFTVTIRDSRPPVIACPSNIVVRTCLERERVPYRVHARDDCDGDVTITCQPPSGSAFPVGTTTVTCVATDDAGNKSECKFDVTVVQEPKPKLTITHLPNGGIQICWPYPSTGYRLQCARALAMDPSTIQWLEVTNEPVVVGGMKCVTLPNQGAHQFYRLCCISAPFIGNVSATRVREGDVITVTGAGFGNNPDNLCAMLVPAAGGVGAGDVAESSHMPDIIPLRVLHAQDDFLTARVGIISPRDAASGLPTGKRIMVGLGQGETGRPPLALPGIDLVEPVWTWQKDGGADVGDQEIQPQPEPPSPNERCFYSGPPSNGVLCVFLEGDWPSNATVCIVARAHDSKTDTGGYDLDGPTIRLLGQGTTLMCADKLADVLRCAFANQAGVVIDVQVTPMADGRVKLTVSIPGGFIDRGILVICVKAPPQPVVTDVTPSAGTTGDIITIHGRGFGNNPDNICAVVMDGARMIPFRVLDVAADGTSMRARLGVVPPDVNIPGPAVPMPIMVGLGRGNEGRFRPAFFDVFVDEPVWVWTKPGPAGMGQPNFVPRPTQPPANTIWFHNEPITDGSICIYLRGNWPDPTIVSITARAHDSVSDTGGYDLDGPTVRLIGGGTLEDCAHRIADILRCAFRQQAGVDVIVEVTPTTDGRVKITVKIPGGHIDRGILTICVRPG